MVRRVRRVGVDLARFHELETGSGGQRLHIVLVDIAAGRFRVLRLRRGQAVLDHAQNAARLQRGIGIGEEFLGIAAAHPVVQVAEGQHDIGGAVRRQRAGRGREGGVFDGAEFRIGIGGLELGEALLGAGAALGVLDGGGVEAGRDQRAAARGEPGREDVGVPAAAGPDFDDLVIGFDAEEFQRLDRVAPDVAGFFFLAAQVGGDRFGERHGRRGLDHGGRFDRGRGRGFGRRAGGQREGRYGHEQKCFHRCFSIPRTS